MKHIKHLLLLFVLTIHLRLNAQNIPCGSNLFRNYDSIENLSLDNFTTLINLYRANPDAYQSGGYSSFLGGSGCIKTKYLIPIVVHIMYDSNNINSNISDTQIYHQIDLLNKHFAAVGSSGQYSINTEIQFCLARKKPDGSSFNGITRQAYWGDNRVNKQADSMTKIIQFDPEKYVNIYVVNSILAPDSIDIGIKGYVSKFPWLFGTDALVVKYDWFGDYNTCNNNCHVSSYSAGTTLAHEMGHYLGLFHIFEGSCAGLDSFNCDIAGDRCCDIPPSIRDTSACYNSSNPLNTCHENYGGDKPDQLENYMSYSSPFLYEYLYFRSKVYYAFSS